MLENTSKYLKKLMEIPSPVGYTDDVIKYIDEELRTLGYNMTYTNKGALILRIEGKNTENVKLITAHVDTLGAVVKEIKSNGRLKLTNAGGFAWGVFEGENALVHTMSGETIEGTFLPIKASVHIYGDELRNEVRNADNMEIRLDENTSSKSETKDLGISVGDIVSFEPRLRFTNNGYIKSRYLDDKVCVAAMMSVIKYIKEESIELSYTTDFYFSNFEEINHGVSVIDEKTDEMIALDIGIVGPNQESSEYAVSILAKDFATPYTYELRKRLNHLADSNNIPFVNDVFLHYGSDASCSIRQGVDVRFACIGLGVDSTHHYERCHIKGLQANIDLLLAYLTN